MKKLMSWTAAALTILIAIADVRSEPPKDPPGVTVHRDLKYVKDGSPAQALDLYLPSEKSDKPLPVIAYIHGGGWSGGSKAGCWALPELKRGYAVVSIEYRFSQEAIFPAQIQDCQAAIRWLRAHAKEYNLDADHIGVWGDSAGGHLVALLGVSGGSKAFAPIGDNEDQSDRVQAVVDWYGPTNFLSFYDQGDKESVIHRDDPNSPLNKLVGGLVESHKEVALAASPITYVSKDAAPIYIEHGTADHIVPLAQSQEFEAALKKAGANVKLRVIDGAGHGDKMMGVPGWLDPIEAFFDEHLKGKK